MVKLSTGYAIAVTALCLTPLLSGFNKPTEAQSEQPQAQVQPTTITRIEDEPPEIRAFLDTIAFAEGTLRPNPEDSYRVLFGGGKFTDLSKHPRKCIDFTWKGKPNCSTAAGKYQILDKTYDRLGMKDMTPESQDRAAIQLLKNVGSYQLLIQGNLEQAIYKANGEWASFPKSPHAQPTKSLAEMKRVYQQNLAKYHG